MKTGKKVLIGIVVLAMLVTLLSNIGQVFDLGVKEETAYASIWNSNGTYKEGSITKTGTLGSASNPFMVLEIVPSYRQAQFGYLVGGQEPIDISAVSSMAESNTKTAIAADLTTWLTKSKTEAVFKDFSSSFSTEDWMNYQNNYIVEQSGSADRYAVYQYVGTGGDYKVKITKNIKKATSLEDDSRAYYININEAAHIYVYAFADGFGYIYDENRYTLVPSVDHMFYPANYDETGISRAQVGGIYRLVRYADDTYGYAYAGGYVNKDGEWIENEVPSGQARGYEYDYDHEKKQYVVRKYEIILDESGEVKGNIKHYAGDYLDLKDATNLGNNGFNTIWAALDNVAPGAVVYLDGHTPYLKVNDSRLENYIAETDADGNPFTYYVVDYEYTLDEVTAGTGDYKLVYKNYQESTEIAANADERDKYTGNLLFPEELYDAKGGESYRPDEIKARPTENVQVYTAYKWELKNNELFKKYALGLIYEDEKYAKGEDVSSYEFLGWYYEPECVNAFNETAAIKKNTTLYAKWAAHYTDATRDSNISVIFNANTTDPVDGFNFSNVIAKLRNGDKIVAPSGTPHRTGYKFTGWYTDAACNNAVTFPYKITGNTTLYAGWTAVGERTYSVQFNSNASVDAEITGMATSIVSVYSNNRTAADTTALSAFYNDEGVYTAPVRPGYVLGGWYWDSSCSSEFDFNAPIPAGYAYDSITLYALWIPEGRLPQYSVSFNRNEPDGAETFASGNVAGFYATYGTTAEANGYSAAAHVLTLDGNIKAKLNNYNVQVVTVNPKDLSNNLSLITRANLIVFSQPVMSGSGEMATAVGVNTTLADRFDSYRNKELFPDGISGRNYSATKYKFTDSDNDISFAAAKNVLMKIAGNQQRTYGPIAPVVYDYSIYTAVTATSGNTTTYEGKLTDGTALNLTSAQKKGFSNNLYKLYLMTQQMNPITLFNAYISSTSPIKGFSIESNGNFKVDGGSSYSAWNKYTLVPWSSISPADYTKYASSGVTTGFDLVGVTIDTELPSGFEFSRIKNRLLIYNNTGYNSIASAFANTNALPASGNEDMYKAFGNKVNVGGSYSTADGVHFMLTDTSVSENFDKDLSILELEPTAKYTSTGLPDTFKGDEYWFWMISRYVPNYSGTTKVTRMSTSQFIGDISEINSLYDIIYIGGNYGKDANDAFKTYQPKAEAKAWFEGGVANAFTIGDKAAAQSINNYYIWKAGEVEVSQKANSSDNNVALHPLLLDYSSSSRKLKASSTTSIDSQFTFSYSEGDYYSCDYRVSRGGSYYYFDDFKVKYGSKTLTAEFVPSSSGKIFEYSYSAREWVRGDFYITYNVVTHDGTWEGPKSGNVTTGTKIYLKDGQWLKTTDAATRVYAYAHTGAIVDTVAKDSDAGKTDAKSSSGILLSGTYQTIKAAVTSGNDITNVKYEDLLNFVEAGYPVIIGSELLSTGNKLDTTIIDTASYVYKFLDKITKDYKDVCFYENIYDVSHEADFLKALKNKSFELKMAVQPVQYYDQTYNGEDGNFTRYTDADVYVNGADPTNKTLKYVFIIDGSTSDTYTLNFFIDTNADGKFNPSTEKLDSVELVQVRYIGAEDNEAQLENPEYYQKVSGATNPKQTKLDAGKTYMLNVYAGELVGGIPWKIEVVSNKNELVTDEAQGLCAIKASTKAHAYVLQIMPDAGGNWWDGLKCNFIFPDNAEVAAADRNGGRLVSVSDHIHTPYTSGARYQTAQNFYKFTRNLEDFEVEFFKLTVSEFTELVHGRNAAITAGLINESTPYWIQVEKTGTQTKTNQEFIGTVAEWNDYKSTTLSGATITNVREEVASSETFTFTGTYEEWEESYGQYGQTYNGTPAETGSRKGPYTTDALTESQWNSFKSGLIGVTNISSRYYGRYNRKDYYTYTYYLKTYTFNYTVTQKKYTYDYSRTGTYWGDGEIGFVDGVLYCENKDGNKAKLNMMFIGFADCFNVNSDMTNEACDVINEFITAGNAVLFTHDTTSFFGTMEGYDVNRPSSPYRWGVNINKYFRDILKLDRYDVTQYGTGSDDWNYGTVNSDAKDWPFKTGGNQSVSMGNMATTSVGSNTYALLQGYTNLACTDQTYRGQTKRVTKSNEGQLTIYPYYIPDEMPVSNTHAQYWQIDFEDDDVVVWYSLANEKDKIGGSNEIKCYSTLNDVRNNYYIYSCGNITYTGVGHDASIKLSDEETKLFVNTMVAAYKSITSPAKPVVTNADKSTDDADGKYEYLYISYDETVDEADSEPIGMEITSEEIVEGGTTEKIFYKRVFFTVRSYSIVFNKELTVHLYPVFASDSGSKVFREYPMTDLKVYEYDEDDPNYFAHKRECDKSDPFEYNYNDSAGVNVNAQMVGYIVETGKNYFVDIPISDKYYEDLFNCGTDASIVRTDGATYTAAAFPNATYTEIGAGDVEVTQLESIKSNFALDSNTSFRVKLDILMRYGKDKTKNKPLSDSVDIVFTRRGMFLLD